MFGLLSTAFIVFGAIAIADDGDTSGQLDIFGAAQTGGGGTSTGGEFELSGTIGQATTEYLSGDDLQIQSGFWADFCDDCAEGDVNCDGIVNGEDVTALLSEWGVCAGCSGDLTGDFNVNGADLAVILANWTTS